MRVFHKTDIPKLKNPVVTIGVFDGVHIGHKQILNKLKQKAYEIDGEPTVISFWPHPRMIIDPNNNIELLCTLDEKIELLEKADIHNFVIIPFNMEFAGISYRRFIRDYLVKKIGVHTLIIGYDHHFGRNREGNHEKLLEFSAHYNFNVEKLDAEIVENENVSSSIIRQALLDGDILKAGKHLGYNYFFSGYIVEGNKLGREIGYPTANVLLNENYKIIPGCGVYAVSVSFDNYEFSGMMNIGYKPTVIENNNIKSIEIHLFDFNENLYGKKLRATALKKIRDEIKFSSIDDLKTQLKKDELNIREFFSKK